MNITELEEQIKKYKTGETDRSYIKECSFIDYSNEYIDVLRIDTSNNYVNESKT